MYALSVSGIIKCPLSVHVLTGHQRLEYSVLPICNLQRCLARSIFCHLELVLFYTVKFYLASCVIIHLNVVVIGSKPSNFALQPVNNTNTINTLIIPTCISPFFFAPQIMVVQYYLSKFTVYLHYCVLSNIHLFSPISCV